MPRVDIAIAVLLERGVLSHSSLCHRLRVLPPVEDCLHVRICLPFLGGSSSLGENASFVSRPASWHILTYGSVSLGLGGLEQQLSPVIYLRYSPGSQQETYSLLVAVEPLVLYSREASQVVVVKENKHIGRVRIEDVVGHRDIDVEQTGRVHVVGLALICESVRGEESQVEVHHTLQVGIIFLIQGAASLPPCREAASDRIPSLSCYVEVGIFLKSFLAPSRREKGIHVGMGILTNSVNPGIFNPPDTVLYQVVGHERILVVEVGHAPVEPSVREELFLRWGRMRVDSCPLVVAGSDEGVVEVEPVTGGQVLHPPMGTSAVVEYHVHNHFHPVVMGLLDKGEILIHRSETRIDRVVISDRITVVGTGRVLLDRVEPDCGYP